MDIKLLGPMPTPGVAYLTKALRAIAGVVISASHNPYYDNGVKFFSHLGFKISDQLEDRIEELLMEPMQIVSSAKLGKASRVDDARGRYIEFCKNTVPSGFVLSNMKIVLDCAFGATYQVAPYVFRELGAEVIELGVEPDGLNINENSGSTHPEILQKVVKGEKADIGIAFDGDGDRVMMVDHLGEVVDGDELLYIMVEHYLSQSRLKGGVVGTLMTNLGLEKALDTLKVPFRRTKVGDRYVMEMLKELDWQLGGEASGHIVHLGITTTGDGVVTALQVLCAMSQSGQSLNQLKSSMKKTPQVLKNVKIRKAVDIDQNEQIAKAVNSAQEELNEGKKAGRVLLRPSGTEPLIRIMVEGEEPKQVEAIANRLVSVIKALVG
jgi:phosphoglucosamine mutase